LNPRVANSDWTGNPGKRFLPAMYAVAAAQGILVALSVALTQWQDSHTAIGLVSVGNIWLATWCLVHGMQRWGLWRNPIWTLLLLRCLVHAVIVPLRVVFHVDQFWWALNTAIGVVIYTTVAFLLVRGRSAARDRNLWIDVSLICLGASFAMYALVGHPLLLDLGLSATTFLSVVFTPCVDMVLLGLSLLLAFTYRERNVSLVLLLAAFFCMTVAILSFQLAQLGWFGMVLGQNWLPAGTMLFSLLGLAALHPDAASVSAGGGSVRPWSFWRGALIVAAFVLVILADIFGAGEKDFRFSLSASIVAVAMFALLVMRTWSSTSAMMYATNLAADRRLAHRTRLDAFDSPVERGSRDMLAEVQQALAGDEMSLHYQPVVRMATREVAWHEALLRWSKFSAGVTSMDPCQIGKLIEAADAQGDLTDWVVDKACADLARCSWRPSCCPRISINIGAGALRQPDMCKRVLATMARHGIAPADVCLELTEHVELVDEHGTLESLHKHGVLLAIDDFGAGYGNLANLSRFDADLVKLDISLVRVIESDNAMRLLCRDMLAHLRSRGVQVVAEGIETEAQHALMRDLGCDYGQGWLYGRPAPTLHIDHPRVIVGIAPA